MSDPNIESTTPPEEPIKPRGSDGKFMSQVKVDNMTAELSKLRKEAKDHLAERNKALMQGTSFDAKYFKGMNSKQVNQFLNNYHAQKAKEAPELEVEPNTPILGTPVGSGTAKHLIDDYLTLTIKNGRPELNFDCPASVAFAKHKNQNEAIEKWLAPQ